MTFLDRTQKTFGTVNKSAPSLGALASINNVYRHYEAPKTVKTPKGVVNYLIAQQQQVYGKTILDQFSYAALVPQAKRVLEEFGIDETCRGIELSVRLGNHPSSFKFVRECVEWYRREYSPDSRK